MKRSFQLRKLPKRLLDATLMQPWAPQLFQILSRDISDRSWIFIVGCYNSGTTLLAELIQTHRELEGLRNEGAFLTNQLPYPEQFGWPRLWVKCADKLHVPDDDTARAAKIKRHWSVWVKSNSRFVVEKSISNTLRIRFLEANFKNARFVHIVRNGYAVAAGIRRKANLSRWNNPDGLTSYHIEYCAEQWNESLNVVEKEVERGSPIITVRYEDIVADPVKALEPVFEFCDVEPIRDASAWGRMQVHEKTSEIRDMNQTSIATLSVEEMQTIRDIAGKNLDRFGY